MKAAILVEQKQDLVIADVALPESLAYGQVHVKLLFSGICGSQIGEIDGVKGPDKWLPHLLGHEGTGVVQAVGDGVRTVKPGDHVVLHWRPGSGIQSPTPTYRWGDQVVNAGNVTTFNEEAIVSENRVTRISSDVDMRIGTLFGCAVTTALGAVNNDAGVKIGESVVVFGVGGVGLNIVQGAALVAAHPIVAVDLYPGKLERARHMGATHTLCVPEIDDMDRAIRDIVGEAGADVIFETSGNARVIESAYNLTHKAGRTILIGVPPKGEKVSIYSLPLHFTQSLTGSHGGDAQPDTDIPRYIRLMQAGKLKLDDLITHEFLLDDINDAIATMRSGEAGRVVIRFN